MSKQKQLAYAFFLIFLAIIPISCNDIEITEEILKDKVDVADSISIEKTPENIEEKKEEIDYNSSIYTQRLDLLKFNDFIRGSDYAVVYFYSPGCQKCSEFNAHYLSVAENLSQIEGLNIVFGKVNANEEKELSIQYEIQKYPTILFFKSKNPEVFEVFKNPILNRNKVERYLRRETNNLSTLVLNKEYYEDLTDLYDSFVLFLGNKNSDGYKSFSIQASNEAFDEVLFYHCNLDLCKNLIQSTANIHLTENTILIIKNFEEKLNTLKKDYNEAEFIDFIEQKYYPDLHKFDGYTFFLTFDRKNPSIYLYRDPIKHKHLDSIMKSLAPKIKTKLKIVLLGIENEMESIIAKHHDIFDKDLPLLMIHDTKDRQFNYKYENEVFNEENILKFVDDWQAGKLIPLLKSEHISEAKEDSYGIRNIIGKEFETVVNDTSRDVIVMFYIDACFHCEELYPIYRNIAGKLKSHSNILFAKFNNQKNETKQFYADKYPAFFIWPSENKSKAIEYKEKISHETFIDFIMNSASNPIDMEDL